jgi:hypothetical protein
MDSEVLIICSFRLRLLCLSQILLRIRQVMSSLWSAVPTCSLTSSTIASINFSGDKSELLLKNSNMRSSEYSSIKITYHLFLILSSVLYKEFRNQACPAQYRLRQFFREFHFVLAAGSGYVPHSQLPYLHWLDPEQL